MGSALAGFFSFVGNFLSFTTKLSAHNVKVVNNGKAFTFPKGITSAEIKALNAKKAAKSNKLNQLNENPSKYVPPIKSIKGLNVKNLPIKTGVAVGGLGYLYSKGDDVLDYIDENKSKVFVAVSAVFLLGLVASIIKKGVK